MPKQHPADAEADRLLAIQRAAAKSTRARDITLIAVASTLILALGIGIFALPHRAFSEVENKALQTFPKVSFERIWSGRFMADLKNFYTDQFPLRDTLVGAKAAAELALGKGENNGVILGQEDYLIKRIEYDADELATLTANLEAAAAFRAATDLPVTFALAPRAIDVLGRYLPNPAIAERASAVRASVEAVSGNDIVSLAEVLAPHIDAGEKVWYRTDHHWTTLGAYYAYAALGDACGYLPAAIDEFSPELVADDFLGTTYSAAGFNWIGGEEMYFYRYTGDEDYRVEVLANGEVIREMDSMYDRAYLEKKDKYAAFLSSNNAHMRITLPGAERPTLLLIKDSFAHAVVPFLARHYDLEILDLRYYRGTVADFLAANTVESVLLLVGVDTLATSNLFMGLD